MRLMSYIGIKVPLNDGEIYCDLCKQNGRYVNEMCPKCKGTGKLDWVENVVGKKEKLNVFVESYEKVDTLPKPLDEGKMVFSISEDKLFVCVSSEWVEVGGYK